MFQNCLYPDCDEYQTTESFDSSSQKGSDNLTDTNPYR